jgi:UDP-3-O-[3-hydroxymyristoyl] glucosamine N-acyltransferase
MKLLMLCKHISLKYNGEDREFVGINTLKDAKSDELSFLENPKYLKDVENTKAGAVFIKKEFAHLLPSGTIALVDDEPYLKMALATKFFAKPLVKDAPKGAFVMDNVHIGSDVLLGENVQILSGAFIGDNVSIGDDTIIYPNVVIYNDSKIGARCKIHANSVIGSDGFGYAHTKMGEHIKIYHNGKVVIEDDVEIGSNSSIDRAVFGETRIGKNSIIDNLVQIGHNCEVGPHCVIVSQTGIAGSSKLGRNVVMGGQSATAGHLSIGDFTTIAARGGVSKSIAGGKTYSGFPLMEHKLWLKLQAKIQKLLKK